MTSGDIDPIDSTDEEKKLQILKWLRNECSLFDLVRKQEANKTLVQKFDHPGFYKEDANPFDYPHFEILNEMIKDGLVSVHLSSWPENKYWERRDFRITENGEALFSAQHHA